MIKNIYNAIISYMHKSSLNKKMFIKRIVAYAIMVLSVLIIATYVVLFTLGYRFNIDDRQIEQHAMIQFNSTPSGAVISIDGVSTKTKTPTKTTVPAGEHTITMSLKGYQTWTKTIEVESGMLDWVNYALLIPEELTVESVANYDKIYKSIPSPKRHFILIQPQVDLAKFDIVDIHSTEIKTNTLSVPGDFYSNTNEVGISHKFNISSWDYGERYVLIKHEFEDKIEWLVFDTHNPELTKNITNIFDFDILDIKFSGTSGNVFYALGSGSIRKIDLSAGTISRPLVNDVVSFMVYDSNILCFVGNGESNSESVIGLYRDGDDNPYIVKTINKSKNNTINASITKYFNEYYIAITNGIDVEVLNGSYPSSIKDSSLKSFISFTTKYDIKNLSFSPSGQYVFIQNGENFTSYDLEYRTLSSSSIKGTSTKFDVKWLNDNYLWSNRDGALTIREFDGANIHSINNILSGQDVVLTDNGRYIYSINSTEETGFKLQRVQIILN